MSQRHFKPTRFAIVVAVVIIATLFAFKLLGVEL